MLTGATPTTTPNGRGPGSPLEADVKGVGNPHHFLAGGQGALPQNSQGRPWNGDYVFSSGDLVEDLTHNFFLETGARNSKLKVYEMVDHPAARALTGYLLVRGGVHQVAYARAVENLTGRGPDQDVPGPPDPDREDPECKPHIERGDHLRLYRFSPSDYLELAPSSTARIPRPARSSSSSTRRRRVCPPATCRRSRPSSRRTSLPRRSRRSPRSSASRRACRRSRPARSRTARAGQRRDGSRHRSARRAARGSARNEHQGRGELNAASRPERSQRLLSAAWEILGRRSIPLLTGSATPTDFRTALSLGDNSGLVPSRRRSDDVGAEVDGGAARGLLRRGSGLVRRSRRPRFLPPRSRLARSRSERPCRALCTRVRAGLCRRSQVSRFAPVAAETRG